MGSQCLVLVNEGRQTGRVCRWIAGQGHDPAGDLRQYGKLDPILLDPFD
jgi:hypothetical protein